MNRPLQKGKCKIDLLSHNCEFMLKYFFWLFASSLGAVQTQTPKLGDLPLNYLVLGPGSCLTGSQIRLSTKWEHFLSRNGYRK